MPRVLNIGSMNIDHVYAVDHFVRPGESLIATGYQRFPGGKGLNQSIALAHAGADVHHAGRVGEEGVWLKERLAAEGVDASLVQVVDEPTGHAIIQVNRKGENAIVVFGGANQGFTPADVAEALSAFGADDVLLLQNEVNGLPDLLRAAKARGMHVAFNVAPMTEEAASYPLDLVDLFIVNETEAEGLTGETDPARAGAALRAAYPGAATVLTLGADGAVYLDSNHEARQAAERVQAVDTTAAGDTFIGFFLAERIRSGDPQRALALGCRAAAVCVTRPGAAASIPRLAELGR